MKTYEVTILDDNNKIVKFVVECDDIYSIEKRLYDCLVSLKELKK